jgi:SAM-dependent methyltransferase
MEAPQNSRYYNRLTLKIFEDKFVALCGKYVKGRLIDIGCGKKPYRDILKPLVTEHIGVDHVDTFHDKANIDLFGTAYEIPSGDTQFDSAISTAVLEHLEEPEKAILECYRVLKPGAHAIYSVPFIWHLHEEPRDFFRYSKYGLKYLFEKSGFAIVEMVPLSGFWVTFIQLQLYYFKRFDRGVLKFLRIHRIMSWLMQKIAFILHRYDKSYKWTWMYMVVVQKPST